LPLGCCEGDRLIVTDEEVDPPQSSGLSCSWFISLATH